MKHSVYLITCNNGKRYVGYTSRSPHIRLEEHLRDARQNKRRKSKLLNALRSHGLKSFDILKEFDEERTALLYEMFNIKKLDTFASGLNMSHGGEGNTLILETVAGQTHAHQRRRRPQDAFQKPKRAKNTRYSRRRRRR